MLEERKQGPSLRKSADTCDTAAEMSLHTSNQELELTLACPNDSGVEEDSNRCSPDAPSQTLPEISQIIPGQEECQGVHAREKSHIVLQETQHYLDRCSADHAPYRSTTENILIST